MSNDVCKHEKYKHDLKLSWLGVTGLGGGGKNIRQLCIMLRVSCSNCKQNFTFKGPIGVSTFEPSISPDGYELRAPIDWPDEETQDENEQQTIH